MVLIRCTCMPHSLVTSHMLAYATACCSRRAEGAAESLCQEGLHNCKTCTRHAIAYRDPLPHGTGWRLRRKWHVLSPLGDPGLSVHKRKHAAMKPLGIQTNKSSPATNEAIGLDIERCVNARTGAAGVVDAQGCWRNSGSEGGDGLQLGHKQLHQYTHIYQGP